MGSKSKGSDPQPQVDPVAQARANLQAQIETLPQAARVQYDINANPDYGIAATSRLYENARQDIYPQETAVRNQLVSNVLSQLISPTGITQEQQNAINTRRGDAQNEVVRALQTRANLGGGLYGGRAQNTEQKAVQDLQNQFVEEDVAREERARLNNSQLALTILQFLYPNSGIQSPNFINPVASAETQYSGAVSQRGQDINQQIEAERARTALQSSLYQALGNVAGQASGAALGTF